MSDSRLAALLEELCPPALDDTATRAFALVDAARDEKIYPAILGADCRWTCLYRGDAAATMAEVAPYLVELDRFSLFTLWLIHKGWGNSWGVFIHAATSLEILRNHFRKFVMAKLPDGRMVYFRFYDPRVLRPYLPTCDEQELAAMFGPVSRYLIEDEDGAVMKFTHAEGKLVLES